MDRMDINAYRKMVQGRVNRSQGERFEEMVNAACEIYFAAGEAKIEKTPEPMKIIRSVGGGRFVASFEKRAQPDYKGTLKGGKAVVFDAKHTEKDRIDQAAVLPHQADSLDEHDALGAICFIVVGLKNKMYTVPWGIWKSMKQTFGHKYMDEQNLAPFEVEQSRGVHKFLEWKKGMRVESNEEK